MKKIFSAKALLISGLLFLGISCQKDYEKEYSWSYPLSGDWTVNVSVGEDVFGPFYIKTYNTSFGQDSIWIDDNENIWPFKAKAKANVSALNFETTDFISYPGTNAEDTLSIRNAKVINKDSIYFEVEFRSDAGSTYIISGHRRQSYDEYMNQ